MNKIKTLIPAAYFRLTALCVALALAMVQGVFAQTTSTTVLSSASNPAIEGQAIKLTATVTGTTPTGTVQFLSGTTNLGTATLGTNGTATYTVSGGAGTYALTAVYSGDSGNLSSTSSVLSQVITAYTNAGVYYPAAMEDGQNYPLQAYTSNNIPVGGRSPWYISVGTSTAISILTNDMTGSTVPDIKGIPNPTNSTFNAHVRFNLSGAAARYYYRPIANPVTNGSVYFSMLMDVTSNSIVSQNIFSLNASSNANPTFFNTATDVPSAKDPLSLIESIGADSNHYVLGIQSLSGAAVFATNQLAANVAAVGASNTYLIVLKYTFGSNVSLYINPTPGQPEPTPSATAVPGTNTPPTNIDSIVFGMSGSTRGTNHYDVMRADTTWSAVTPSAVEYPATATKLLFSTASQTNATGTKSALITLTLADQAGNPLTNSSGSTVASLASTSGGATFYAADGVTVISSLTFPAGVSTQTFYYADTFAGSPTITAASGLLTPASQVEQIIAGCTPPTAYGVTGGGAYCSTGTAPVVGLSGSDLGVSYQLYSNSIALGSAVSGTGSALNFGSQLPGTYTVAGYVTSSPLCSASMTGSAVVTVNYAATVSSNPTNKSVLAGFTASFSASAGNTTSPSYQWQVSSNGGSSYSAIAGATNPTYTTAATTAANNGNEFECVITGVSACGTTTATSSPATLTVTKAVTTNTLVSSVNPAVPGAAITFTATVTGPGIAPSGTVTFLDGSFVLGVGTLSGGVASLTTSAGVGTNAISAVYGGDLNNFGSTSGTIIQVVQPVQTANAAQMQEGFDYGTFTATASTPTNFGPWLVSSDFSLNTASTVHVMVLAGDLSGATSPDVKPLPNVTNAAAHFQISAGASDREVLRSIGTPATNGSVYWSFILDASVNPTTTDEYMATMLGSGTNKYPDGTDPVTLHTRKGADTTHYNLGIQRLGGTTVYATNSLSMNSNYLVVLKYTFGPSSTSDLYIDPIPGYGQPFVSSASATAGTNSEPPDIGTILTYEAVTTGAPTTSGAYNYDVMRADTNWYNVTPPASLPVSGAASLAVSSAPQTFSIGDGTPLPVTITLLDQSNNVFTAVSDLTVSLSSSSTGGSFISSTDEVTLLTNVVIPAGSSTVSFYYNDSIAGFPVITASSGLLAPATQTELVNPPAGLLAYFTVSPSVSSTTAGSVFTATVQAYGTNGVPIVNHSVDGLVVTLTSSGLAKFDANGDGVYGDNQKALTNGTLTIIVSDPKAESLFLTAAVGTNTGTSPAITITPSAAAQLQVLLPGQTAAPGTASGQSGTPVTQVSGTPFNVTVNLVDSNYNVVSSSDTIHLAETGDGSAVLPANTALSGGSATLTVTDIIAGSGYLLTASDVTSGSIPAASSASYSVIPGAVAKLVLLAPGETATPNVAPGKTGTPSGQLQGVPFTLTVDAFDANYNLVTAASDVTAITSTDSSAVLPANAALSSGTKSFTIAQNTSGSVTDTASDVTSGSVTAGTTTISISPVPKYKSVQSGIWESSNTWAYSYDGMTWTPATNTPTYLNADVISITNGYTVTITSAEDIDQTVVATNSVLVVSNGITVTVNDGFGPDLDVFGTLDNFGTITPALTSAAVVFESAATYLHDEDGGSIVTATWATNANCNIVGWKVGTAVTSATHLTQKFGNFTWNSPNQTSILSMGGSPPTNFSGNFNVISTGTGELAICLASTVNLNVGGNLNVTGGTLIGGTTGSGTEIVNVAGDVNISGGTVDPESDAVGTEVVTWNLGGNLNITGGTLTAVCTNRPVINFVKGSTQLFTLTGSGSIPSSSTINWGVTNGSTLDLGTTVISGKGSFTVYPGAGLKTAAAGGFAGNIALTVATNISLSSGGNYTYDGAVAQSGDTVLPSTVSSLTVSNVSGVSLAGAEVVTNLNLAGSLAGSSLTLAGTGNLTAYAPSTLTGNVSLGSGSGLIVSASSNALSGLTIESGTLSLGGGPIELTVVGAPLVQGTYPFVSATSGGSVSGALPVIATANGSGFAPAQVITPEIISGQLFLTTTEFLALADAGPGFFSGENLILTNGSGQNLYAWSSTNPSLSVSNWTPVGLMFEQSLNDGTGRSYYSINVTPTVSPTYYLAGSANGGPYIVSPVPVGTLTTADFASFNLAEANVGISAAGVLNFSPASPPTIVSSSLVYGSGGFQLQFSGTSGHNYVVQASTNLTTWTTIGTGTFGASAATFTDPNAGVYPKRFYRIGSQ